MVKVKHKYNINDTVKFKFFDGEVRNGRITKLTVDHDKPTYKIRVDDSRGFTVYPCMTNKHILEIITKAGKKTSGFLSDDVSSERIIPFSNKPNNIKAKPITNNTELDNAIDKQKNFLRH